MTNRFREKIRYLEADLRLEPKNEALMHRLAYSHASLALSLRDTQPKEADEAIQRARQLARQRAQAYPNAIPPLDWVHQDLNQLAWAPEANGFMLPQMMQTSTGQINAMPGPMMNPPGSVRPPGPGMGPAGPTGAPPSSPGTAPPSFIASPMNVPQPTTRADQEKALRAAVAGGVARRAEAPDDLTNLYALGTAYQQMAQMELDPRKRRANVNLKLALEVYRDAAKRSRTRIHKASHLSAAAEVYGELGDSLNQYRMAKLASEQAPFSPSVWDKLQDAALRVGRFSDSRTAARKAREWQLPMIQGASLMPAQFGTTGTMASP